MSRLPVLVIARSHVSVSKNKEAKVINTDAQFFHFYTVKDPRPGNIANYGRPSHLNHIYQGHPSQACLETFFLMDCRFCQVDNQY